MSRRAFQTTHIGIYSLTGSACHWLQSKDGAWQSKAATEWRTLRQVQGELETEKGQAVFLGTSLAATVCKCIHLGDRRSANKLRDKFHISERRFAWLVVRSPHTKKI